MQPGTFQPACLQGRRRAHRLAAVPGPRPGACEATTRTSGLETAETPEDSGAGVIPPVPGGLWSPRKATQYPLHSLLGLPTHPGETLPRGRLSGQRWATTAQARLLSRASVAAPPACAPAPRWPLGVGGLCPRTAVLLPGRAQRGLRFQAQVPVRGKPSFCPPDHWLLPRDGQAVPLAKRNREPEAHEVESVKTRGRRRTAPGTGAGGRSPRNPGPQFQSRQALPCVVTQSQPGAHPMAGRLLRGLGSPGRRRAGSPANSPSSLASLGRMGQQQGLPTLRTQPITLHHCTRPPGPGSLHSTSCLTGLVPARLSFSAGLISLSPQS